MYDTWLLIKDHLLIMVGTVLYDRSLTLTLLSNWNFVFLGHLPIFSHFLPLVTTISSVYFCDFDFLRFHTYIRACCICISVKAQKCFIWQLWEPEAQQVRAVIFFWYSSFFHGEYISQAFSEPLQTPPLCVSLLLINLPFLRGQQLVEIRTILMISYTDRFS